MLPLLIKIYWMVKWQEIGKYKELPVIIFQLKCLNIEEEDIKQNSQSVKDSSNNINNYLNG